MNRIQGEEFLALEPTQERRAREIRIEPLGGDIVQVVNRWVPWGSGAMPVLATPEFDTHLLVTYCHRICNDAFREPMNLSLLLVEKGSATLVRTQLPYNHSESFSVRALLGSQDFRGVCFAWTEAPGNPWAFSVQNRRLAPIFYAFYENTQTRRKVDCVHSSPSRSNYVLERVFWVPQAEAEVFGIVCAPLDAYRYRASHLKYELGLREGNAPWRRLTKEVPFTPVVWIDLAAGFGIRWKASVPYLYSVQGPKGKGWLFIRTPEDFNLHHM